jgi:hypothetical protein
VWQAASKGEETSDEQTLSAVAWGGRASVSMIALDEALSAPKPHPRSLAFAVQAIYPLAYEAS